MSNTSRSDESDEGPGVFTAEQKEIQQIRLMVGYVCVITLGFSTLYIASVSRSRVRSMSYIQMMTFCILFSIILSYVGVVLRLIISFFIPSTNMPPESTNSIISYPIVSGFGVVLYFVFGFFFMHRAIRRAQNTGEFRIPLAPRAIVNLLMRIFGIPM